MPNEPKWLLIEEVIAANKEAVAISGEPFLMKDRGLLEGAIGHQRNLYFYGEVTDVVVLAVDLMLSIARNHPFLQGNKRAGFMAAVMFIESNGFVCDFTGTAELGDQISAVVAKEGDDKALEDALVREFKSFTRSVVSMRKLRAFNVAKRASLSKKQ